MRGARDDAVHRACTWPQGLQRDASGPSGALDGDREPAFSVIRDLGRYHG